MLSPLWLAALPGLIAVGLWALTDVQRFILFAVLAAMILPASLAQPGGTQVALADLLLVVALAAWLIAGAVRAAPRPWISGNRLLLPTLLFVGINAQSVAWSVSPRDTVQFTIQLVEIVVIIPLVFASLPRSIAVIRCGLMIYIGLTCVMAAIYVPYAGASASGNPLFPESLNKNAVGSYLAAGLVMAYALLLGERRAGIKVALGFATLIELAGLMATSSRGAIVGAFVALIAVSLLLSRKRLMAVSIAIVASSSFIAVNGLDSGADLTVEGAYDSSLVRVYSFSNAVDRIHERPILGTGAGTYEDYIPELQLYLPDPNNLFLLTWAEIGIFGMLGLVFLLFRYGILLFDVRRLPDVGAVPAVAAGCAALSMLVHFQFDVTWTRGTSSLAFAMMGLMIASKRLCPATLGPQPSTTGDASSLGEARAPAGVV